MLYGCEDSYQLSGNINVKEEVGDATATVTGRIVDASTNTPIQGAAVDMIVNGAKRSTTSATSSDEDLQGYFSFSGVPATFSIDGPSRQGHTLNISATGYADFSTRVPVPWSMDNTPITVDLGTIGLGEEFTLTVVVTNAGTPVQGATVVAIPDDYECSEVSDITFGIGSANYQSAVTDSSGIATLLGLNECYSYDIVVPAFDADGDGVIDYVSGYVSYGGAINSDTTVAMVLTPARRDDSIAILTNSMMNNQEARADETRTIEFGLGNRFIIEEFGWPMPSTGTDDPIVLVFNYPVALTGGLNVSYVDDLIDPDVDNDGLADTGYSEEKEISVSTSLDSTGTILTITPPAAGFPKNEVIDVRGAVTAIVNGLTQPREIDFLANGFSFVYIEDDTSTGLSSTGPVTADNYSGSDIANPFPVWLEFPEFVSGTYTIVSTTVSGITTIINDDPVYFPSGFTQEELIYTDGDTDPANSFSGFGSGVFYRVALGTTLKNGDTIEIELDVTDAVGNRFSGTNTLTVE
jgi:hypothetical protein